MYRRDRSNGRSITIALWRIITVVVKSQAQIFFINIVGETRILAFYAPFTTGVGAQANKAMETSHELIVEGVSRIKAVGSILLQR